MRPKDEQPANSLVLSRDRFRCVACGLGLSFTLVVHHVVPRELGGEDGMGNLTTLCPNCHRIVHWLSVGRRLEGEAAKLVGRAISRSAFVTLGKLASRIRRQHQRTRLAGAWVAGRSTRGPVPLRKALTTIAIRNGFETGEEGLMARVLKHALKNIPEKVRDQCAFRLFKGGRCLSVHAGSNLALRTPAYSADGKRQDDDLLLIWPRNRRISTMNPREWRRGGRRFWRFSRIPYYWIPLSFQEALSLTGDEWRQFGSACETAARLRRARTFVSNVKVSPSERKGRWQWQIARAPRGS